MLVTNDSHCSNRVWHAAYALADFVLRDREHHVKLYKDGARVLEIGAGTGWLGMSLLRQIPSIGLMLLTEMENFDCLDRLSARAEEFRKEQGVASTTLQVAALDWADVCNTAGHTRQLPKRLCDVLQGDWDVILGSDLVYNDETVTLLPQILRLLLEYNPEADVLYAHTLHRWGAYGFDAPLLHRSCEQGLHLEPVYLTSESSRHAADGPQASPEQRPVVFKVSVDATMGDTAVRETSSGVQGSAAAVTADALLLNAVQIQSAADKALYESSAEERDEQDCLQLFTDILLDQT
ncbi:hypothetical protein CYMTET_40025 [Cymbomonas tetramitiformis]|uniref:Uncharacterized protein n=1 Tax=Cymbomonas tetramitiformis TaxID=36881 RepID=A0AAE0CB53_9CHLO|nr:hypothetical protein CYMTET_40025 [Cymbomonas tetramitiformis]|eukprot:gene30074-37551_t